MHSRFSAKVTSAGDVLHTTSLGTEALGSGGEKPITSFSAEVECVKVIFIPIHHRMSLCV